MCINGAKSINMASSNRNKRMAKQRLFASPPHQNIKMKNQAAWQRHHGGSWRQHLAIGSEIINRQCLL